MKRFDSISDFNDRLLPRYQMWESWQELRDELQYQWDLLTGEDLEIIRHNQDQISDILQNRYGFNNQQAAKAVENFFKYQRFNVQLE